MKEVFNSNRKKKIKNISFLYKKHLQWLYVLLSLQKSWALSLQYLSLMFSLKKEFVKKGLIQTTDK